MCKITGPQNKTEANATKLFTAKYGAVTQHQKPIENDKCWDHFKKIVWLALAAIQRENWISTRREESNNELSSIQCDLLASSAQKIFTVVDRNQHEMCFFLQMIFPRNATHCQKHKRKKLALGCIRNIRQSVEVINWKNSIQRKTTRQNNMNAQHHASQSLDICLTTKFTS